MRRHLIEGYDSVLGVEVGTLIYGAGKGIFRSFQDFDLCVEPYMKAAGNVIYYFGDLDYEGIGIYENLTEMFAERWEIIPFVPAYEAMLRKAGMEKCTQKEESLDVIRRQIDTLPETKEGQIRRECRLFFSYFEADDVEI